MKKMSTKGNVYVGRLSEKTQEKDLETAFSKFGKLIRASIKKGYGFVVCVHKNKFRTTIELQMLNFDLQIFEDEKNAEEAIKAMNGADVDGSRIIVEMATGGRAEKKRYAKQFISQITIVFFVFSFMAFMLSYTS